MTPAAFLLTSVLLGLMVLAAGAYGALYAAARLTEKRHLLSLAALAYGVLAVDAVGVVAATPLGPAWKALVVASALAYLGIPPLTWRYLKRTHGDDPHGGERGAHA